MMISLACSTIFQLRSQQLWKKLLLSNHNNQTITASSILVLIRLRRMTNQRKIKTILASTQIHLAGLINKSSLLSPSNLRKITKIILVLVLMQVLLVAWINRISQHQQRTLIKINLDQIKTVLALTRIHLPVWINSRSPCWPFSLRRRSLTFLEMISKRWTKINTTWYPRCSISKVISRLGKQFRFSRLIPIIMPFYSLAISSKWRTQGRLNRTWINSNLVNQDKCSKIQVVPCKVGNLVGWISHLSPSNNHSRILINSVLTRYSKAALWTRVLLRTTTRHFLPCQERFSSVINQQIQAIKGHLDQIIWVNNRQGLRAWQSTNRKNRSKKMDCSANSETLSDINYY